MQCALRTFTLRKKSNKGTELKKMNVLENNILQIQKLFQERIEMLCSLETTSMNHKYSNGVKYSDFQYDQCRLIVAKIIII